MPLRCDAVARKKTPKLGRAIRSPIGIEIAYRTFLLAELRTLDSDIRRVVNENAAAWCDAWSAETGITNDSWSDDIGTAFGAIADRMLGRLATTAPHATRKTAGETSSYNRRQWRESLRSAYGVDVVRAEPWLSPQLAAWEKENMNLITNMSANRISAVQGTVQRAVASGTRSRGLIDQVAKSLDVGKGRAKTIARDQVSKLNANLTQIRQRDAGVDEYEWSTSQDERVRPTHRANAGKRFKWSKAPAATGHPGNDVNCRCVALPVFPDIEEMLAAAGMSDDTAL